MSIDVREDLECIFDDWGVDITLWPGDEREATIEKGAVFQSPSELVDVGGQVRRIASAPAITMRTTEAQDLLQDDALTVHPSEELGVAGGNYSVVSNLPESSGLSIVELMDR